MEDFKPTDEEWILWARKNKLNNDVIGFIVKNTDLLNSNTKDFSEKNQDVHPSRRSWKNVSDFLNLNPKLEGNIRQTCINGLLGIGASARFDTYLKQVDKIMKEIKEASENTKEGE